VTDKQQRILNIAGLVLELIGVIMLFLWGTPFFVPTGGLRWLALPGPDPKLLATEHLYTVVGYFGFAALVLGTSLQIVAAWSQGRNVAGASEAPNGEIPMSITAEGAEGADKFFRFLQERSAALVADGYSELAARDLAQLEWRVANWPKEWVGFVQVILFGDFQAPQEQISLPAFGITIDPENCAQKTFRSAAFTALMAKVTVREQTVAGLQEAAARINTLLSIWAVLGWGNSGFSWWSHITHGSLFGLMTALPTDRTESVLTAVNKLDVEIRRRVLFALYWIREPRQFAQENHLRSDGVRLYAGYWNAFECLVEAIQIAKPEAKLTRTEKQRAIEKLFSGKQVDAALVTEAYLTIVRPGFVGKAKHALAVCFGENAERYIYECFEVKPERDRLYQIRNDIDHGAIDGDDGLELFRVSARHRLLWEIVFIMLGHFIPTDRPVSSFRQVAGA